jgi:predicted short-subunit dehydrogenase-like oxidoreductase (DUF2520 family)
VTPEGGASERVLRIGFVDAGRLGGSLAVAVRRVGYPVAAVSRRDPARAAELAKRIGGDVLGAVDPQRVVDTAEVVFLTTTDDRIGALASSLRFRPGQTVVHCSGATPVAALGSALSAGATTGGFHPLQTFPDEHGADRLRGVTFGVESGDPATRIWLERLAAELGGTHVVLDETSRPLYHASAVMIGPLTAALAGLACELWTGLGRDREAGIRALAPLMESTVEHVTAMGLPDALTGPFARGDVAPVRAHLEALRSFRPEAMHAYAALALAQLPIAAERGNIPEHRMQELVSLLSSALLASTHPPTPRGDKSVSEENHAP